MVKNIIAQLARKKPLQDDNEQGSTGTGNSSSSQEDDKAAVAQAP
jgi:hypothetical protein